MDPGKLFADERFAVCVYCGGTPSTVDHVPSKVLLDEPYPASLPVVQACRSCNNGFAEDEVYIACLVDCAVTGSADCAANHRVKIKRLLTTRPALAALIMSSRREPASGNVFWEPDLARARNVVLKLARGHAAYELSEPKLEEPEHISFVTMCTLSADQLSDFESPPVETGWPEIGSRAFLEAVVSNSRVFLDQGWRIVQRGRYRYLVSYSGPTVVRFVLSEYLACEVVW